MQISRRADELDENMIVRLAGDIDLSAIVAVRSAFHEVLSDGWSHVIVDLEDVTFLDSAALGILIGLHRRCREASGVCVLVNVQPDAMRLLSVTGLDAVFAVATDIESACVLAQSRSSEVRS